MGLLSTSNVVFHATIKIKTKSELQMNVMITRKIQIKKNLDAFSDVYNDKQPCYYDLEYYGKVSVTWIFKIILLQTRIN